MVLLKDVYLCGLSRDDTSRSSLYAWIHTTDQMLFDLRRSGRVIIDNKSCSNIAWIVDIALIDKICALSRHRNIDESAVYFWMNIFSRR